MNSQAQADAEGRCARCSSFACTVVPVTVPSFFLSFTGLPLLYLFIQLSLHADAAQQQHLSILPHPFAFLF
jgi:hypothetical protein